MHATQHAVPKRSSKQMTLNVLHTRNLCRIDKMREKDMLCRYLPWQYQTYSQHKYENPFEAKEHHCQLHGISTA
jgi:hypothetical protein